MDVKKTLAVVALLGSGYVAGQTVDVVGTATAAVLEHRFARVPAVELTTEQVQALRVPLEAALCPVLDSTYGLSGDKACNLAKYFRRTDKGTPGIHLSQGEDGKWYVGGTAALPVAVTVVTDAEISGE